MIDEHVNNPKSIKYYIKRYFESNQELIKDKKVVDVPAGNGAASEILYDLGAKVTALDLFPEYFLFDKISCQSTDITQKILLNDNFADVLLCQEGIEHLTDQMKALKEFNRVIKLNGKLVITTPSYSHLAARMSYLLFESENLTKMPPNEIDDVWMSDKTVRSEIYYGHIFLIGLQKLRILGLLAGFQIKEIRYVRLSKASVLWLPLLYPFIFIHSWKTYLGNTKKDKGLTKNETRKIHFEQLSINTSIKNLLNKHIFVIFEKVMDYNKVDFRNEKQIKPFGKIM